MSAAGARRTARWRRWARLPAVVALLFATSVVAATVEPAAGPGHAPMAVPVVSAAGQSAAGQRPDIRIEARGGPATVAPDLGALAWLPARAGAEIAAWWRRHQDADGWLPQTRRTTYQGRGPPGRRAADVPS